MNIIFGLETSLPLGHIGNTGCTTVMGVVVGSLAVAIMSVLVETVLIGVHTYPTGHAGAIGVQIYPTGQSGIVSLVNCACAVVYEQRMSAASMSVFFMLVKLNVIRINRFCGVVISFVCNFTCTKRFKFFL